MASRIARVAALVSSCGWLGFGSLAVVSSLAVACGSDASLVRDGDDDRGDDDGPGSDSDYSFDDGGFGDGAGLGGSASGDPCDGANPPDYCILKYETAGPGCGDGKVNQDSEECDDGNGFPGDGCNGLCLVEINWDCSSGKCVQTIVCGDGVREGFEVCDDGDEVSGNGCSADCLSIDPFYLCPVDGGACVSTVSCGDGRISGNEQCEDGNTDPDDGCDSSCRLEPGWFCSGIGKQCQRVPFCGDGVQGGGEECDDGNLESTDGCSTTCKVEEGFACPEPGKLCIPIVITCGDGALAGAETCDDGNKDSGDGCAWDCQVEPGFSCPTVGALCSPICGDGRRVGNEACDDGGKADGDGCSSRCTWEPGFFCQAAPPHGCVPDTCGNGKVGNGESCDDGNKVPGDGCSPECRAEPGCGTYGAGGCTSKCGDGLVIGEQCDDGNTRSGDGCSSTCRIETGFECVQPSACALKMDWDHDGNDSTPGIPTCVERVPVIYRDFDASHPHFEPGWNDDGTLGMVLGQLDAAGKPQWSGISDGVINSGNASDFANWYRDSSSSTTVLGELLLWDRDRVASDSGYAASQNASGISFVNRWGAQGEKWSVTVGGSGPRYQWCSNNAADGCGACPQANMVACHAPCTPWNNGSACAEYPPDNPGTLQSWDGSPVFFPIDGRGRTPVGEYAMADIAPDYGGNWDAESRYVTGATEHNFHFTSEIRRWFKFDSSKTYQLDFTGDDDVWVFINGKLAVDLGGWHPPLDGSVTIDASTAGTFNLVHGRVYEIVVFQAERKKTGSSYRLTLSGFNSNPSVCTSRCGDGVVASTEQCDDGTNAGGYGMCQPGCLLGARCGDGSPNGGEACDNGVNLSGYNDSTPSACAPGCKKPSRCGDNVVDYAFGEICDLGMGNSDNYGSTCSTTCQLAPHCGDGKKNGGEECDDGVNDGTAGCGPGCLSTSACGNGQLDPGEDCDDGVNDGGYGECGPSCQLVARCGDGQTQSPYEQCDDGVNDGGYGECGPNCRLGEYCGDGRVNGNEQCDDGQNDGGYGECQPGCKIGPYCGDKKVQPPEQCDDGNRKNNDGCSSSCRTENIVN